MTPMQAHTVEGGSTLPAGPAKTLSLPVGKPEIGKVYSLEDVDPIGRTEVLIYGAPGSCKTTLAATFPAPFRWIDADKGLKSLRWAFKAGLTSLPTLGPDSLQAYRPEESDRYPVNPEAFDRMTDMIAHWFTPEQVDQWSTVVVDSATEVNMWAIYKGLHLNGLLPNLKRPLSQSDEINEKAKTLLLTGQQDYKSAQGLFQGFISDLRVDCAKHQKNLVVICHEWTDTAEDADGNVRVVRYEPWLIGQLRQRIAKDFDDVWYTELFNGKEPRVMMFGDPRHVAKTRWGQIPEIDKEFDFRKMIAKVKAYHGIK